MLESGLVDKIYNLWERNPITVRASYLASNGQTDAPPAHQAAQLLERRTDMTLANEAPHGAHRADGPALEAWRSPPSPPPAKAEPLPQHQLPPSKDGNLVVGLCDGETSMEVKGVKEGERLRAPRPSQVTSDADGRLAQEEPGRELG